MTPKVSVIVTCYNQEKYISQALESIYNQTEDDWECIIIDDGSIDGSSKMIKSWTDKDARYRYIHKSNGGVSSTRNVGLNNAMGRYIQFLDGDDFLDKQKIELALNAIGDENKICISNFVLFDDLTGKTKAPYCSLEENQFSFREILLNWDGNFSIPIHCGFFGAELFQNFKFPEHIKAKEDWLMWVILLRSDPKVVFLDRPLAIYRIHPKSITMSNDMFKDHMLSLEYLKQKLAPEEYEDLLIAFVERYYRRSIRFKRDLLELRSSRSYFLYSISKKIKQFLTE